MAVGGYPPFCGPAFSQGFPSIEAKSQGQETLEVLLPPSARRTQLTQAEERNTAVDCHPVAGSPQ